VLAVIVLLVEIRLHTGFTQRPQLCRDQTVFIHYSAWCSQAGTVKTSVHEIEAAAL